MLVMLIVATAAVLLSTKGTARPGYLTGSLSESRLNASRTESGLSKVSSGKLARVSHAYRCDSSSLAQYERNRRTRLPHRQPVGVTSERL